MEPPEAPRRRGCTRYDARRADISAFALSAISGGGR